MGLYEAILVIVCGSGYLRRAILTWGYYHLLARMSHRRQDAHLAQHGDAEYVAV